MKKFIIVDSDEETEDRSKHLALRTNASFSVNNCSAKVSTLIPCSETLANSNTISKSKLNRNVYKDSQQAEKLNVEANDLVDKDRSPFTKEDEEIQHWVTTAEAPCLYYYRKENLTKKSVLTEEHKKAKPKQQVGLISDSSSDSVFEKNKFIFTEIQRENNHPKDVYTDVNKNKIHGAYFQSRPILGNENLGLENRFNDQLKKGKHPQKRNDTVLKKTPFNNSRFPIKTENVCNVYTNFQEFGVESAFDINKDSSDTLKELESKRRVLKIPGDEDYDSCSSVLTANYIRSVNANVKCKKKSQNGFKKNYFTNENKNSTHFKSKDKSENSFLNKRSYDSLSKTAPDLLENDREFSNNKSIKRKSCPMKKQFFSDSVNKSNFKTSVQKSNNVTTNGQKNTSPVVNNCTAVSIFPKSQYHTNSDETASSFVDGGVYDADDMSDSHRNIRFGNSFKKMEKSTISFTKIEEVQVICKSLERCNNMSENTNTVMTVSKKYVTVTEKSICSNVDEQNTLKLYNDCDSDNLIYNSFSNGLQKRRNFFL